MRKKCYQCQKEKSKIGEYTHNQNCLCKNDVAYIHDTCLSYNIIELYLKNQVLLIDAKKCAFCDRQRYFSNTDTGIALNIFIMKQCSFLIQYVVLSALSILIPLILKIYQHGIVAIWVHFPILCYRIYLERYLWRKCMKDVAPNPTLCRTNEEFMKYCFVLISQLFFVWIFFWNVEKLLFLYNYDISVVYVTLMIFVFQLIYCICVIPCTWIVMKLK